MIRIDEIWLSTQPMDMRAGMDTTMAQVVRAFGYIKPHCAYLFCNKRGHRMKVLIQTKISKPSLQQIIDSIVFRLDMGHLLWCRNLQQVDMILIDKVIVQIIIFVVKLNDGPR